MIKIELAGADNARDFGGTVNEKGKRIAEHRFIRSNALNKLTAEDINKLRDTYHLECVIDLRTAENVREKPDVAISGAKIINIPIFEESGLGIKREQRTDALNALPEDFTTMPDLYRRMVTDSFCIGRFRQIFKTIMEKREGSILWHCSEGKDRCGLVSALFLKLMDVPDETVLKDYLKTNEVAIKRGEIYRQKVLEKTGNEALAEKVRSLFIADETYFAAAMEAIQTHFGGMNAYIEVQLGISPEMKAEFQKRNLE